MKITPGLKIYEPDINQFLRQKSPYLLVTFLQDVSDSRSLQVPTKGNIQINIFPYDFHHNATTGFLQNEKISQLCQINHSHQVIMYIKYNKNFRNHMRTWICNSESSLKLNVIIFPLQLHCVEEPSLRNQLQAEPNSSHMN